MYKLDEVFYIGATIESCKCLLQIPIPPPSAS